MKHLRQLSATFVLTLVLSTSALAGEIHTPGVTPTPTPTAILEPVAEIEIMVSSSETTVVDTLTEITLNLIDITLSLF